MQSEAEFNKQIRETLDQYESMGIIKWYERLNSLKAQTITGTYIQGCRKGTPDWIVILKNKLDKIAVLFIEAKSDSGLKVHKEAQDNFMDKYNQDGLKVIRTADIKDIIRFIDENEGFTDRCFREIDLHMGLVKYAEEEF